MLMSSGVTRTMKSLCNISKYYKIMLLELYWTYQNISLALRLSSNWVGHLWLAVVDFIAVSPFINIWTILFRLISVWIRNGDIHRYNTRRCHDLHLPRARTNWGKHRFVYHAVSDWNNLHFQIRQLSSLITFKVPMKRKLSNIFCSFWFPCFIFEIF